MISPEDAKRYLDFTENGKRDGLTDAELAGVERQMHCWYPRKS